MKNKIIHIGITQGDINGIGYEVIFKTLLDQRINESCMITVYGSPKIAAYHRKALRIQNFSFNIIKRASEAFDKRPNLINVNDDHVRVELGKVTPVAGQAAFQAIDRAVQDLKMGEIDALVTAPIQKESIQSEDFKFPGHTEFLESKFTESKSLMLLCSEVLKVGVVAGHVPISQVPSYISKDRILEKLRILNQSLEVDFNIRKPKIAVFGLNPHAGDNGLLGNEEIEIIKPALDQAREEGIIAMGPFAADGFFGSVNLKKFDAILSMYHDQGLAPFKAISFDNGVNFTAGLPVVRTSPDHGTAMDISGKGVASENSFRQALYLAIDIAKNRKEFSQLTANQLVSRKDEVLSNSGHEDIDAAALENTTND